MMVLLYSVVKQSLLKENNVNILFRPLCWIRAVHYTLLYGSWEKPVLGHHFLIEEIEDARNPLYGWTVGICVVCGIEIQIQATNDINEL